MIDRLSRGLRALGRRFGRATAGVAAVEFALVLPVMLVLYIGMVQVTIALNMDRKVTVLSRTVADLVGRVGELTPAEMTDIIQAALHVLAPYDASQARIVLSSVVVESNAAGDGVEGSVCWSFASTGATALPADTEVTVPPGFDVANTSFILAEVRLPYNPLFRLDNLFTTITLTDETAWPVRNTAEVDYDGTTCLGP